MENGEKLVGRPNKSIYGFKKAANNWYKELAKFLLKQGFTRSRNDHCLFARAEIDGHTVILVWVDDIIVASRSMAVISDIKKALEGNISHGRQREITLVSGSEQSDEKRPKSHSTKNAT